jgi:hypothetical protein
MSKMTRFVNCFLCFFCVLHVQSQIVFSTKAAEAKGMRISGLDSSYKSALHSDSLQAVFYKDQDVFIKQYQQLVQELGKQLKQNGVELPAGTKFFHRLYFNASGKLDYYLFKFKDQSISAEQQAQFEKAVTAFFNTYTFPAKKKFAQCCTVMFE